MKLNLYTNHRLQYLVIIALYLTACAGGPQMVQGDVINLYHTTAEWLMDGCRGGTCGSEIFQNGKLIIYARPFLENVAFIVTDDGMPLDKLSKVTGNLVNLKTWDELRAWLLNNGWTVIASGNPLYQTAVSIGMELASMELLPVFAIWTAPTSEMPEWVTGEQRSE